MESIVYIVLTVLLIVILVIIAKYNKLVKLFPNRVTSSDN